MSGTGRALDVWLQLEHLEHDERINRLAMDAQLVADMRAAGWQGEEWDFVANLLAEYGLGVIGGWMRRGVIMQKCAERRVRAPALPEWVYQDADHRDEITTETVLKALQKFQSDVLPNEKWKPTGGASLSTFFIGQCLFQYGNAVQKWQRGHAHDPEPFSPIDHAPLEHAVDPSGRGFTHVENDVIRDAMARAVLDGARTDRGARALQMEAFGYSHQEIAAELGTTPKAVSSLLDREKRYIRQAMAAEWAQEGRKA